MWVKGETLFPFNTSVSLDLLLIHILEAQGLNTIYTLINRQGFEHRGWVSWSRFYFPGDPSSHPQPRNPYKKEFITAGSADCLWVSVTSLQDETALRRGKGGMTSELCCSQCVFISEKNQEHVMGQVITSQSSKIWEVRIAKLKLHSHSSDVFV